MSKFQGSSPTAATPAKPTAATTTPSSPTTTDLCDKHVGYGTRFYVAEPCLFHDYGAVRCFHGRIDTIRCFESDSLLVQVLSEPGRGRVLVIDGGGSKRFALIGELLAKLAQSNHWSGIIVNGCIRDAALIRTIQGLGVKALGTYPMKSTKGQTGERDVKLAFAGVEFVPGQWLYADEDGIVVSPKNLVDGPHPVLEEIRIRIKIAVLFVFFLVVAHFVLS